MDRIISDSKANEDGVIRWRNASDRDEISSACVGILTDLERILFERVIPFEYAVGERFRTSITIPDADNSPREIFLVGEMDLLIRKDGRYQVWDLKATKDNSYWRKSLGQLIFYDVAVMSRFNGQKTSEVGFIQPACKEQILTFNVSDEERKNIVSRIISYAQGMWRDDVAPKVDKLSECYMCPVAHACVRFKSRVDSKGHRRIPLITNWQDHVK